MLTLTLSTLGLPLAGVGLLLAIDPILDMGRTAVNVAGQALVPTIVSKRQGILDQAQYDRAGGIARRQLRTDHAEQIIGIVGRVGRVGCRRGGLGVRLRPVLNGQGGRSDDGRRGRCGGPCAEGGCG